MRNLLAPLALVAVFLTASAAPAQEALPKLEITHRSEPVHLREAKATITPNGRYYYIDHDDAKEVLVAWGNPPQAADNVLGMLFPVGMEPQNPDAWGVVIQYDDSGYVTDQDAATANYAEILTKMQADTEAENTAMAGQGYPPMHLVGWAAQPSYDPASHVVTWAQDLHIEGSEGNSLNYDIRVLGRRGILVLKVVAPLASLASVQDMASSIREVATFNPGQTYADHKSNDKMAGFGVAGLVAGGAGVLVAKKVGLLAILLVVLKKGFVFIIAGAAGVWGTLRNKLGLKKKAKAGDSPPPPSDSGAGGGGGDIVT